MEGQVTVSPAEAPTGGISDAKKRKPRKSAAARTKKNTQPTGDKKPRRNKPKDDPRFETLKECPLCGGSDQLEFCAHAGDRYLTKFDQALAEHKVPWWFCDGCGLVFQNPRLTEASMAEFYAEKYRSGTPSDDAIKGKLHDSSLVVDFIRGEWNPVKMSGKCLDIGASEGCLVKTLAAVHKAGGPKWDAYGVEPNRTYAEYARDRMMVQVATEPFTDKSWRGIDFRLITAQHVIEHIHGFKDLLRTAKKKLRPDGRIYVGTPAVDLPWGEAWARIQDTVFETYAATHLQLFSSRTLARTLNDCGFYVEKLDHYIRGTMCLARHANEGERNELAGKDDPGLLIANVQRGHEMWKQYVSDPQRRHPFVQAQQGVGASASASKIAAMKAAKEAQAPVSGGGVNVQQGVQVGPV